MVRLCPYAAQLALTTAAVCFMVVADASTTTPVANLCFVARASRTSAFMVADHAVDTYRSTYPRYDWRLRAVGRHGNGIIKDAVQAFAVNGTDCDILLGPGASSYAIALSPVVDIPWIDFSASSVELSDDAQHPFFSRMIPSDAYLGRGMATLMRRLGWGTINVVCSNEAYGRSITQRLAAAFALAGGKVAASACLETNADVASAEDLVRILDASPTRIVAVGMNSATAAFHALLNVTLTHRLYERYVFLFSESMCSGDPQWRAIPGALCMTFRSNATRVASFEAGYAARNRQPSVEKLAAVGIGAASVSTSTDISVFDAFSHDAVQHAMAAVSEHARAEGRLDDRTGVRDRIRSTVTQGLSGTVALSSTGDRSQAQLLLLNIDRTGAEAPVAFLENETLYGDRNPQTPNHFAAGLPTVFWFGRYESAQPPADIVQSSFELSIGLLAIAISAVLVAAILAFVVCIARRNRDAIERLMAGSVMGLVASGLLALAVVTVKILVATAVIIDDIPLGYLVSYLSVAGIGIASTLVDCVIRFRFVGMLLTSDEGLPFETEQYWLVRVKGTSVFTTVMSDLPTLVICSTMLATGTATTRLELIIALSAVAAFAVGYKITMIPSFLAEIARRSGDEDEEEAKNAAEDAELEAEFEDGLLPDASMMALGPNAMASSNNNNDNNGDLAIEDVDAGALPTATTAATGPIRPDGDTPLIAFDTGVAPNPFTTGGAETTPRALQKATSGEFVSWDAVFAANHANHHHHQRHPDDGLRNGNDDHTNDGGTDAHSARTQSGLQFKLQQAGRTVARRLQEERIRKRQVLDVILPEVLHCYGITPLQVLRSRFGLAIAASHPALQQHPFGARSLRRGSAVAPEKPTHQ